jgi:hypothetical protein
MHRRNYLRHCRWCYVKRMGLSLGRHGETNHHYNQQNSQS